MKKFISGILVGTLLMTSTFAFAETKQTIEAIFGQIKLVVDGKAIDKETLLYNGTTYVPLRAAAEALGKEVSYDSNTKTAYIGTASADEKKPITQPEPKVTPSPVPSGSEKANTPVTIEEFPYTITVLEPNSIGTRYMEATFKNNSKYPVTKFQLTVYLKDQGKKTYLNTYDTTMPGETSIKFDTFAPASGSMSDMEILETSINIQNSNGETVYIDYDHKLKKYSTLGKW